MIQSDSMMQVSRGAALPPAPDCYCWWLWQRRQLIAVPVALVVALVLLGPPVEFGFGGMQQRRRGCPRVKIAFVAGKVVSAAQQLLAFECVASADVVVDDVVAPDVRPPVDFDCSSFVLLEPEPLLGPVVDAFPGSSLLQPFGLG